jgi:hypothetical protein
MKRKKYMEGDDGHTVAPMNIEGMPWYRDEPPGKNPNAEKMTRRQMVRYTFYAVLAGLCIVAVFGAAAALFIRFCTDIWFR